HFIVVRDVATGAVDTLTASVDNYLSGEERQATVAWSPAGDWIAFTNPGRPWFFSPRSWLWGDHVSLVRPDGSGLRQFAESETLWRNFYPGRVSWSADGRWLVAKLHHPDMRLALIEVETGDILPL